MGALLDKWMDLIVEFVLATFLICTATPPCPRTTTILNTTLMVTTMMTTTTNTTPCVCEDKYVECAYDLKHG